MFFYKNYILFNQNIITNDKTSFYDEDNNKIYEFNKLLKDYDDIEVLSLKDLNEDNDVEETGEGNTTDTFIQVIEDKEEILCPLFI